MKLSTKVIPLALVGALLSPSLAAEALWSDNSLTLLKNINDFEQWPDKDIVTLTLEHASAHSWGDVFFFLDRLNGDDIKESYFELSGRWNLAGLTGEAISFGPISNLYLTAGSEHSEFSDNYMGGISADWQIPGFNYFQTSVYQVNNDGLDNETQLTVVYGAPFKLGNTSWMIDGYIDWSSAEDDHASDFHFNPQIRMDLGEHFGSPGKVEVGVEYSYWHNKFGVSGLNESMISAIVKVHL